MKLAPQSAITVIRQILFVYNFVIKDVQTKNRIVHDKMYKQKSIDQYVISSEEIK